MRIAPLISLVSFFAGQAIAHGGVTSYLIDGQYYIGWLPYLKPDEHNATIARPYNSFDPITDVSSPFLSCNGDGRTARLQRSAPVKGGGTVTAYWSHWTHFEGPVVVYMAKCRGICTLNGGEEPEWFKIHETGLISGTVGKGEWANGLIVKELEYTVTIPPQLAPGEYLIRHEIISIHQPGYPQFTPQCAQIIVTSGEGIKPPARFLTKFPGAYSLSDPGLAVNIYSAEAANMTEYEIPGPAVWKGERE